MFLAGPPTGDVAIPPAVARRADGRRVRPVWANELGGLTFEIGEGHARSFLKWAPEGAGLDLAAEAARLRWVGPHSPVPEVLGFGTSDDPGGAGAWLELSPIPGSNAVDERWKQDPAPAVRAIGVGLRRLHDAAPVDDCPFDWSVSSRVAHAQHRAAAGLTRPDAFAPEHQHLPVEEALVLLEDQPAVDRLVVCHGDACAPNTLLLEDGAWSGHVDVGALGVADRWADLAVATWSTGWNHGPGWEDLLLEAYGIDADPRRTAYYRLLWDLT